MIPGWAQQWCQSGWAGTDLATRELDPSLRELTATETEMMALTDLYARQHVEATPAEHAWQRAILRLDSARCLLLNCGTSPALRRAAANEVAQVAQTLVALAATQGGE